MRIAAIYDIHGNLPALEAVLEEIKHQRVDRILVGGDVLPGPMPRETLAKLSASAIPIDFIRGNGEVAVLQEIAGEEPGRVPPPFRPLIEWTARQLDRDHENFLRSWRTTVERDVSPLGKVLFCHATPQNENDVFTSRTPERQLVSVFRGVGADMVVCGHTHMQFDRLITGVRVVNAGSVGMPFGKPGAYWILVGPDIEFRRTDYDLDNAAEQIRASGYPQAEQFAANNILSPPTEEQMLQVFDRSS